MSGFDWPILMRAGLQGLGLKPGDFWQLTPVELKLMLAREPSATPLLRSQLDELLQVYPDHDGRKTEGKLSNECN